MNDGLPTPPGARTNAWRWRIGDWRSPRR